MGVNTKAELTTIDQVLAFYDLHKDSPCFCVYAGVMCKPEQVAFDYLDTEQPEEGRAVLEEFLNLVKSRSDNNNQYTIQLVDEWKEVDVKGGQGLKQKIYKGKSLRFQLNPNQPYNGTFTNDRGEIIIKNETKPYEVKNDSEVINLLKQMLAEQKEENILLKEKVDELLVSRNVENFDDYDDEGEEEDIIVTPKEKIMSGIGAILQREEVQEGIAGLLLVGKNWIESKLNKKNDSNGTE